MSVKTSAQAASVYVSPGTARQTEGYSLDSLLYWTLHEQNGQKQAAHFNLKIFIKINNEKRRNQTIILAQACVLAQACILINASLTLSRFVQPNIISINTSVFTARVLSRPQHGMWPTRWLDGPFLFLNHLIFCPLRWKLTPLNQRNRNWSLRYQLQSEVLCFLKETHKKNPALSHFDYKIDEMNSLFANNIVCSFCEIKDEVIAWQMCFVDHAVISLHCCREEINISRIWAKLTYIFCLSWTIKAETFGM